MTIALYMRLSEADGDLGIDEKSESNSIENQRFFLYSLIKARDDLEGEVVEYIDDGYSGTNFNRPAFKRMIDDAKKGRIQVILVKDLSRFGRNYITVGDYIEQIFPMLNIRFIAATNGFDSMTCPTGGVSFETAVDNLINTFYSRDLSQKIKNSYRQRWKNCTITSHLPLYGYVESPTEKGKRIIEPEAGKVVRRIFDEALNGRNTSQIAYSLNEDNIPTPGVYNLQHKLWNVGKSCAPISERKWTVGMVRSVLVRYEYTGAMVYGRKCNLAVGSSKRKNRPESDWTILENMTEPIVTKEEYEKANQVIRKKKEIRYLIPCEHLLKGVARCGNCKRLLDYMLSENEEVYYCHYGRGIGKHSNCYKGNYDVKQLEGVVWYATKELLDVLGRLCGKAEKQADKKIKQIHSKIKALPEELLLRKNEKIQQYELYADGVLTKEQYLKRRDELTQQIEKIEAQIAQYDKDYNEQRELLSIAKHFSALTTEHKQEESLTRAIVEAFIKDVLVYGKKRVVIEFKNEDEIFKMLNSIKKNKEEWTNGPLILPDED